MALLRIDKLNDYASFLRSNETETLALYHDILIRVTSFFRDPKVFEVLKRRIFPRILKGRKPDDPIRIWVPGCSTGEEAYSIAICLSEYLGARRANYPVQIFATDLSELSIDHGREGVYIENVTLDVSAERLRRFFTRTERQYRIKKSIRETMVFARQNLAKDPPFSRLDLISCRNVLIYLGSTLRKKVVPTFHYALRPGGFLLLGTSEAVQEFADLFSPVDKKARIFVRRNDDGRFQFDPLGSTFSAEISEAPGPERLPGARDCQASTKESEKPGVNSERVDLQREANRIVLQRYTPPGMVVTSDLEVVYFFGQGHRFFEPAAGQASFNLMRILREGLAVHVRTAIATVSRDGQPLRKIIAYSDHEGTVDMQLEVNFLRCGPNQKPHFSVLLRELSDSESLGLKRAAGAPEPVQKTGRGKAMHEKEIAR
jgi:two-component system, chemotaxis family, CheB/CheR fusion protein